jgi:CSLREA domain-containing protein
MTFLRSKRNLLLAAVCIAALQGLSVRHASAQQIGYFTFDTPATANPADYSYSIISNGSQQPNPCGSDPSALLFCFNNPAGATGTPSFIQDPANSGNWVLQMNPAAGGESESMWFSVPQNVYGGFNAWFQFKIAPSSNSQYTADGFAFVIQNANGAINQSYIEGASSITLPPYEGSYSVCSETQQGGPSVVGGGGGCMGYGGIDNSVALEFDTYSNNQGAGNWDPTDIPGTQNDNHIALQSCGLNDYIPLPNSPVHLGSTSCLVTLGAAPNPVVSTPASTLISNPYNSQVPSLPVTLADGQPHQVVVVYNGPNDTPANYLYVYLDPAFQPGTVTPVSSSQAIFSGPFDITQYINVVGDTIQPAYVGFTSGTGLFYEQHEITGWTFTPHTPVQQSQPINTSPSAPATTTFSFGTHAYSVTYPPNVVPAGTNMTVNATQISQSIFDTLIAGTPFAGSQCQEYDDTGTDNTGSPYCIFYNVSCQDSNGNAVSCPAPSSATQCTTEPNNTSCIALNSSYNNANTPLSPGFLQGDPLYSPISSNNGGTSSTVTCQGECAVTDGQASVYIDQVATVNNVPTLIQYGPLTVSNATPNSFSYSGTASIPPYNSFGSPEFVTSVNVQNIFTSYESGNLDGSTTGKTQSFSDFIVTSDTVAPSTTTTLGATTTTPDVGQVDGLTATVTASTAQFGAAGGTVAFSTGLPATNSNTFCSSPLAGSSTTVATAPCDFPEDPEPGPTTIYATYSGDANHAGSTASLLLNVEQNTVQVSFGTSPAGLQYSVRGTTYTTPQTETLTFGTGYAVSVPTPQTLLSNPGVEYVFSQWSDGTPTAAYILAPTVSTASTDTAIFNPLYQLSVTVDTHGAPSATGGTATLSVPAGYYAPETQVTLTAVPNSGYYFNGWTGYSNSDIASPGTASTTVTISGVDNLVADFEPIPSYVVTTLTDDGDGQTNTPGVATNCPAAPETGSTCSLRDAISAASANGGGAGNITFASGLKGTVTINGAFMSINGQISIEGPGANIITLSGGGTNQIFNINPGTYTISGLTLANAYAGANGGALYINPGANVTTASCVFNNNTANSGGAIYNNDGILTVSGSVLSNNTAYGGQGGGIFSNEGMLTVTDSTFSGNQTTDLGGAGIYVAGGSLSVSYSTFSGNISLDNGGGIIVNPTQGPVQTTISNSTFSGNTSSKVGGAIYVAGGTLTVTNNIFALNSAATGGAGIYNLSPVVVNISNNLYYHNFYAGTTTEADCFSCGSNANAVRANPNLAPLGNYGGPTPTMIPLPSSAAICAGPAVAVGTDQRGFPNTTTYNGATCYDLGAVQTNYGLSFTTPPPSAGTIAGTAMSPAPAVTVTESSVPFTAASLSLTATDANNDLTTTPATAATTVGIAPFTSLIFSGTTNGDKLTASLPLNANLATPLSLTAQSTAFSVSSITPAITFAPSPNFQTYGTAIGGGPLDATVTVNNVVLPASAGTISYTTTIGGVSNQPVTSTSILPAGTYTITATFTSSNTNLYGSVSTAATYTVNKAPLTVTPSPNPATMTYGGTVPSLTPSYSGFVNGTVAVTAAPSCTPGVTSTTPAGTHTGVSSCSGGTAPANYVFTYATGSVTVNPATLTVTPSPNPATMTYGGTVPSLTPSYSGFVNGTVAVTAAPSCTPGVTSTTPAGTHTGVSSCSGGTAPANYVFTYATGSVTVNPATLTVTPSPNPATMTYGGTVPVLTPSYSGFVNGTVVVTAAPSCTPGVTSTTPAGTHTGVSSCSGGTAPANYTFTYATGSVIISQASQTISFTLPAGVNYGIAPIALPANASSGLPITYAVTTGPGSITGTSSAPTLTITGSGTVTVTASQAGNTNYNPAPRVTQSVVVTAVPLATLSPSSVNLGTVYLGSITTQTVTLTNTGDATMTLKGNPIISILQGGDSSEFVAVNLCPSSLAPGKSCNITVTFVAGPFYNSQTAELTVNDSAAGSPQSVMFTALVIDPIASFSTTGLSFGTVKTGTASTAKSITVTSVGATPLSVSSIAFTGADPGDFSQNNNCTAPLAPKGTCTINVVFKPGARTARSATLVITTNAHSSTQNIGLSGTGN